MQNPPSTAAAAFTAPGELAAIPRIPASDDPRCRDYVDRLIAERWTFDHHMRADVDRFLWAGERLDVVAVAVHHGNFPTLEYMGEALQNCGRTLRVVYLQGDPPQHGFAPTFACRGSLARLAAVTRALPAQTIYLQAHGRWSFLSQFISSVAPQLRVVQELWDWMAAFIEPEHESVFVRDGLFETAELALMRFSEVWLRDNTLAFVHKHGGRALDDVVKSAVSHELRIMPAPPRSWMRPPIPRQPGPWRLVHAGQIKPSTASRGIFGDLQILPLIRELTAQGLEVTAYAPALPPGKSLRHMLGEYLDEDEHNPRFALRPRLEVRDLIASLHGNHDFGTLLYHFDDDLVVGRRHLKTALASKLFVYIAAGLPILVSPELEYMAELIGELGVGLVVPRDGLANLSRRLDDSDYGGLLRAVAVAQTRFCTETWLPHILDVMGQPLR